MDSFVKLSRIYSLLFSYFHLQPEKDSFLKILILCYELAKENVVEKSSSKFMSLVLEGGMTNWEIDDYFCHKVEL